MLRNLLIIVGFSICSLARAAFADEVTPDTPPERRQPVVAVWRYSLDPSASRCESGARELNLSVANAVSSALSKASRFTLLDSSTLDAVSIEYRPRYQDSVDTPDAAVEAGRRLRVDYVLFGNVENVSSSLCREESEYEHKGRRECTVTWKSKVEVTVHHVAVDVRSGEIWKEWRDCQTREDSGSYPPSNSDWRRMFSKAADRTASAWVRQLVPYRQGKVIARGNGVLVINLGRVDGVGTDTDFSFTREETLRDISGAPIRDEDGDLLIRQTAIQAAPSGDHKPGPVFGRPVEIQDTFCTVKVGYRGSGGFLGLDTKLKENANCLAAVQVGDRAVLSQHVGK
jgi:hypothetical protein